MPRSAVARCVKQHFQPCFRGMHTKVSSSPFSIAKLLHDVPKGDSEEIVVNGFIRSIRNQKKMSFASVGDGSSLEPLQAILTPALSERLELSQALRIPYNSNHSTG